MFEQIEKPEDCPSVTVAMPVRNASATICLAIQSILWQTLDDWELLLFDDGSTDGTLEKVARFKDERIRIISDGRSLGLGARLNQAMEMARGAFFARMDGDDIAYPDRFAAQLGELQNRPDLDLLGTGTVVFDSGGRARGRHAAPPEHTEICARPTSGFRLSHPTWMGRTEWFRRFRYREDHLKAQDQDLLLRAYRTSRFANLPEIYLGYREESLNIEKILRGRSYWIRTLVRELNVPGRRMMLTTGVMGQFVKGLVDIIAVSTGLRYTILRHRALPLSMRDRRRWSEIWSLANGGNQPPQQGYEKGLS